MPNTTSPGASQIAVLLAAAAISSLAPLSAQQPSRQPASAAAQYKGIWEAVNYSEDVEFTDVFFVTGEVGWAVGLSRSDAGEGGFILHTKDAGQSWELQFGDPHSATRGFWQLDFIDERHGWATWFGGTLLRTTDGVNWEPMGAFVPGNPFAFVSPNVGFYLSSDKIHRTTDGGRTWKEQFACTATIEVEGLKRTEPCSLTALDFASPTVGYAASKRMSNGATAIVKTEDGGLTWRLISLVADASGERQQLAFLDEQHGYFRDLYRFHATSDGGLTWRGVAATIAAGPLQFADPEVGWFISGNPSGTTVSYTTDGGRRWNTRERVGFPTAVVAFSAPRRDRAYVVGTHGMVYRYRIIPIAETMPPRSLPAPLMPGFDSPLDEQVGALDTLVEVMEAAIATMPDSGAAAPPEAPSGSIGADSALADPNVEGGALPPASGFTTACCAKRLDRLYLIISAVAQSLPQFLSKNKNNNLLLAGLRMITDLPQQFGAIKTGLRAFRQAGDKESAKQALAQVSAAADALHQSAAVAFQKELPPVGIP